MSIDYVPSLIDPVEGVVLKVVQYFRGDKEAADRHLVDAVEGGHRERWDKDGDQAGD